MEHLRPTFRSGRLVALIATVLLVGLLPLAGTAVAAPANDDFADATVISGALPQTVTGTTVDAGRETGEPVPSCAIDPIDNSIWWTWTAPTSGRYGIDYVSRDAAATLALYSGVDLASLSELGCAAREGGGVGEGDYYAYAALTIDAVDGMTYHIQISTDDEEYPGYQVAGAGVVEVNLGAQPTNDDFADATPVPVNLPQNAVGTTAAASRENGEPVPSCGIPSTPSPTVWWSYTPTSSGEITLDTIGDFTGFGYFDEEFLADFPPQALAVYTGPDLVSLTEVGCSHTALVAQAQWELYSRVQVVVDVVAGTTYWIQASDLHWALSDITLHIQDRPGNDDLAHAAPIAGPLPRTATGSNLGATTEVSEPWAGCWYDNTFASVWWTWIAPGSGTVQLDSTGTETPYLAVYDSSSTVACGPDDGGETVVFWEATAGVTYLIQVTGIDDSEYGDPPVMGAITLTIDMPPLCDYLPVTVDLGLGQTPTAGDDVILGTANADVINGLGGNDTICGAAGNDTINGGPGNDSILAGDGDDVAYGSTGADTLDGGPGDDTVQGNQGLDTIDGGPGDDVLAGNEFDDTIHGGDGADTIYGGPGDDHLYGGDHDDYDTDLDDHDTIVGGLGSDWIHGQDGDDLISGNADPDYLWGGDGDDTLYGVDGDDQIHGDGYGSYEPGADVILGGVGNDSLSGDAGDDQISGNAGDDTINGDDGNDTLYGVDGDDTINGGYGTDTILGGIGDDNIVGGPNPDLISGNAGNDTIAGNGNNDTLYGVDGNDVITGGYGNDVILAGADDDTVDGGPDDDQISGEDGDDTLTGGTGNDNIYGQGGDDTIDVIDGEIDGVNGGPHIVGDTCTADVIDNVYNCEL